MTKFSTAILLIVMPLATAHTASAQEPSPSAQSDVDALREQVKALNETVKALQKQVQDQQTVLEKANIAGGPTLPQNPSPSPPPAPALPEPSPAATAAQLIPTEDSAVVASAPKRSSSAPPVDANGNVTPGSIATDDSSA